MAYSLGITKLDPIRYNLLFERFLNPERVSMPDIDVDFCFERRQEVIDYVVRKYGKELPVSERTCEYVGIAKVGKNYMPHFVELMQEMVDAEEYTTWWETILYAHCYEFPIHTLDVAPYFWSEIDYIEDYERIVDYVGGKNDH